MGKLFKIYWNVILLMRRRGVSKMRMVLYLMSKFNAFKGQAGTHNVWHQSGEEYILCLKWAATNPFSCFLPSKTCKSTVVSLPKF